MKEGTLLNNRYQLLETLGSGGMADVFRARDLMLDRYVAIKILRKDYSSNADFQERFRQEARSAANLSHPNIVTVHDFGFIEDQLFIVMEHIPGRDMKSLIRQRGRFTVSESILLMVQACAGIGYAHRAGLVHCDVKPHNILVTPDLRVKVTDFGIARALATIIPGEKSDVVWGSPQYFSPEQAQGEAPSPASDVYSLGVVLYEMLSGTPPFTASTADEMARLHISARPLPISEYVPDVPSALEEIVMKVLSKEPAARYRTADQLGRVLKRFGTQPDEVEEPPVPALTPAIASRLPTREIPSRPRTVTSSQNISQPISAPRPAPEPINQAQGGLDPDATDIDWASVGLGLLALLAVGGLFPFWIMVYFAYNPR
jgi:eukaryotic-like serine/threonine-protein kinase